MNNIKNPFQIPIYQSSIDEDSFIQIKKDVLSFIDTSFEKFETVWDCPTLSTINIPQKENIQSSELNTIIKIHTENYFKAWGLCDTISLNIDSLWVNISPKNSYQESHKHLTYKVKNVFSGVLYISSFPNSGNLSLVNPIEDQLMLMVPFSKVLSRISIPPEDKNIILFPSWLEHYVGENKTEENRISVSWNIEVINK